MNSNSGGLNPEGSLPASGAQHAPAPRGRLRRVISKALSVVLLLLSGGALWTYASGGWSQDQREALPPEPPAAFASADQLMVTAEPVEFRPVQRVVEAVGTLYGFEEIVISAQVEGHVRRIHHEVADRVMPDELLVEIDRTDYELAVEQAQNQLEVELAKLGLQELPGDNFDLSQVPTVVLAQVRVENSKLQLDRIRGLAAANATSQSELENATSDFRTAEADRANQLLLAKSGLAMIKLRNSDLEVARQQLADTQIRAPRPHQSVPGHDESGLYVITGRSVAEGSYVRPGDEICTLAIDRTLKLRVPVPERYSAQIAMGQRADVFTAAFADPFSGVVTLINPAVATATRTFDVEIQIGNPTGALKPGSFAKAIIQTGKTDEAATVPLSALVSFAGVTKVFLAKDGSAREVLVTPGVQTRDWVEIVGSQFKPGDLVITSGQSLLADETPIALRQPAVPNIASGTSTVR